MHGVVGGLELLEVEGQDGGLHVAAAVVGLGLAGVGRLALRAVVEGGVHVGAAVEVGVHVVGRVGVVVGDGAGQRGGVDADLLGQLLGGLALEDLPGLQVLLVGGVGGQAVLDVPLADVALLEDALIGVEGLGAEDAPGAGGLGGVGGAAAGQVLAVTGQALLLLVHEARAVGADVDVVLRGPLGDDDGLHVALAGRQRAVAGVGEVVHVPQVGAHGLGHLDAVAAVVGRAHGLALAVADLEVVGNHVGVVLEAAASQDDALVGLVGLAGLVAHAVDLAVLHDQLSHAGVVLDLNAQLLGAGGQGVPQLAEAHLLAGQVAMAVVGALHIGPLGVEEGGLLGLDALGSEPVDVLGEVLGPGLEVLLLHLVQTVQVSLVLDGALDAVRAEDDLRRDAGVAALVALGRGLQQQGGAQALVGGGDGGADAGPAAAHDDDVGLGVPSDGRLVGGGGGGNSSRGAHGPGGDGGACDEVSTRQFSHGSSLDGLPAVPLDGMAAFSQERTDRATPFWRVPRDERAARPNES